MRTSPSYHERPPSKVTGPAVASPCLGHGPDRAPDIHANGYRDRQTNRDTCVHVSTSCLELYVCVAFHNGSQVKPVSQIKLNKT